MRQTLMLASILVMLAANPACNRGPSKDINSDSELDRVSHSAKVPPQRVTHGIAKLSQIQKLPFDVPPHQLTPRLTGSFTSFVQGAGGARISDESADVELMVMTDEQYD